MSQFIDFIASYIKREAKAAAERQLDDYTRCFFVGPPREQLDALFDALTEGEKGLILEVAGVETEFPVYLLDQEVNDPVQAKFAAVCTPNYLTTVRNFSKLMLALSDNSSPIATLGSATKPLGIPSAASEFDDWCATPLVSKIIDYYLEQNFTQAGKVKERAGDLIRKSLAEAWDRDSRSREKLNVWRLMKRFYDFRPVGVDSHVALSAALGYPNCSSSDFGLKVHSSLPQKLAEYFESHGLATGFEELSGQADDDIKKYINDYQASVSAKRILDAVEYAREPYESYFPEAIIESSLPNWWLGLTLDQLMPLLEDSPQPRDRLLELNLLNTVGYSVKGMPSLVETDVELVVCAHESLQDEVEVELKSSNGNAQFVSLVKGSISSEETFSHGVSDIPEHSRFLRYRGSAEGFRDATHKVIALDNYKPGLVVLCRTAKKATQFKLNKRPKGSKKSAKPQYECDIQLSGIGMQQLDLFVSEGVSFSGPALGYSISSEHDDGGAIERPIHKISARHFNCLIESDEECHYDLVINHPDPNAVRRFRIHLTADAEEPQGARSEFDRLVAAHRASATKAYSNAKVDTTTTRLSSLEEWSIEDPLSYIPLVLGPDLLNEWRKPDWPEFPTLSGLPMPVDPRPAQDLFKAPDRFVEARIKLFAFLRGEEGEPVQPVSALHLHEFLGQEEFEGALREYLDSYLIWLQSDYEDAVWADIICILHRQHGVNALEALPYVILMSPLHPIRLAWQCGAQKILQDALVKHERCPAASMFDPAAFPDCLMLPCRTATGSASREVFASVRCSSDYWGVLWSVKQMDKLVSNDAMNSIFGPDFGISIDGLSSGFSSQQTERVLEEITRLVSARSTIRIGISSEGVGSSSCNDGIERWCYANLGNENDPWYSSGPRGLIVEDNRKKSLHPESSALASLVSNTDGAVKWFTEHGDGKRPAKDLSVLAHLGTMNHEFTVQRVRSAIDASALARWRVRKQLPGQGTTFIAESRIGEPPIGLDSGAIEGKILLCVDELERRCSEVMDSYVFAPNIAVLASVVSKSRFTALSSSSIDAACFFGSTENAYLWDYELPNYSRRAGENSGYYLLATESEGMVTAVRSALSLISGNEEFDDSHISSLLKEISRRGMPTLKRLTGGGSMSLGEVGMLVAMRLLQSEFEESPKCKGILPVVTESGNLNLVIPADPFRAHFDDLRHAIDFDSGERPDILSVNICFASGTPVSARLTPIEVKARGALMPAAERQSALGQASNFAALLAKIREKSTDSKLWGLAWRSLIATLLDYAFRVYGQLDEFMQSEDWAMRHSEVLRALASTDLELEICETGRLIVIDDTNHSCPLDVDGDEFNETVNISHKDALKILSPDGSEIVTSIVSKLYEWSMSCEQSEVVHDSEPIDLQVESGSDQAATDDQETVDDNSEAANAAENIQVDNPSDEKPTAKKEAEPAVEDESDSGICFNVGHTIGGFSEEPVEFFPGNTALNQLNVGIVGDLGTGKTQLIQSLIYRLQENPGMNRGQRPNILIFDYKKDYTKPAFVDAIGAKVIKPYRMPVSLFDTRDKSKDRNVWLSRSKFFADVLKKIYTGIGPAQQEKIKAAVKASYKKYEGSGAMAFPTIDDVFEEYKHVAGGNIDSPYSIMSDIVDGEYFEPDSSKVVPFSEFLDGIVVIDLADAGADDATKNALVVMFLNLFYEHMLQIEKKPFLGQDPSLRFVDTMLLVDEADNIMKYEFEVLKKILLQGREFGVGVLLASQYLSHFKTAHENYTEPLLTWFVHKVPNIKLSELESIGLTNVSVDLIDKIRKLNVHECVYKTYNVNGRAIQGKPFYEIMEESPD